MDDINLITLAVASFIFAISPGPGILAVLTVSVSRGAAMGIAMSLGEVCGDMVYLLIAMISWAVVAAHFSDIFVVVRILGAGYLGYLGIKQMMSPPLKDENKYITGKGLSLAYGTGVMISLTNPKVIVFYLSFLPLFIDLSMINLKSGAQVMSVMFFSVLAGPLVIVVIGKKIRDLAFGETSGRLINIISGALMIGVGVLMVSTI